ncbi:EutN/CcmL family microcompartment protein [Parendozoicomonas haliclonae]|uniref:Ethanolamine utilization protein EutN n=1 Tax=Parendozoicomonas haliclonae TaxID=1960125 RepID=A0A1X7ALI6_9GAMM|nr:EutN/CcmL family microcompartment protein [Parendozoicomonas haliclonae]SMA48787.1 Ethanolamine utilization protein EutN [Parendozoicomonas haliclonae]
MLIGKVVGNVWATRKHQGLDGFKLMVVHILDAEGRESRDAKVAIDNVGAGFGDHVLLASGGAARMVCSDPKVPVDLAVVGIIDDLDIVSA